jgi:hypothetical protein
MLRAKEIFLACHFGHARHNFVSYALRPPAEIVGLNPTGDMDVCLL